MNINNIRNQGKKDGGREENKRWEKRDSEREHPKEKEWILIALSGTMR